MSLLHNVAIHFTSSCLSSDKDVHCSLSLFSRSVTFCCCRLLLSTCLLPVSFSCLVSVFAMLFV